MEDATEVTKSPRDVVRWLFDSGDGTRDRLIARWIFLRSLAAIYFSAFLSLAFQIKALIGPNGILPAQQYLSAIERAVEGAQRFWYAPSLFWISSSSAMLMVVTWLGLVASVLAFFNLWPRLNFFVCFVCFLSFVSSASDFASYQSDGMLLEAGFIVLFFAPPGVLPGWGATHPPSRASLILLLWEWFRIYFESGMVKLLSGDPQWRHFTAMDDYYQNLPLPSWPGWYVGHLPHWFHAAATGGTLLMEFCVVLLMFFPRRARIVCFLIVTPWEIVVILTGNYAFLNYIVLCLGVLLLDDTTLSRVIPRRFRPEAVGATDDDTAVAASSRSRAAQLKIFSVAVRAALLTWIAYATTIELVGMAIRPAAFFEAPVIALEPFRIANQYGLFAVMTRGRYEIEFQGSNDNQNWTPYLFRYKPQALDERPGVYAPYQPRFEWNLWFASLGNWEQNQIVPFTEARLLVQDVDVLNLFRGNPFPQSPPRYVRAVLWQYWFTSMEEKHRTGNWWRRSFMGQYAPTLSRNIDGQIIAVQPSDELPPHN
jgi:lipase maturation factor 1